MRRRAFLASALAATSTTTAGCNSLGLGTEQTDTMSPVAIDDNPAGSRTKHTNPVVKTDTNPRDTAKYLEFRNDGANLATVGVETDPVLPPKHLRLSISHPQDTELQSLTQRFVAPDGDGPPPQLSLQGPFQADHGPHPSVSLFQEGKAAVVAVHRFGGLADETAFMFLTVTRWPESARRLVVESTAELVEIGAPDHSHVLEGDLEFEFSAETSDETTDSTDYALTGI